MNADTQECSFGDTYEAAHTKLLQLNALLSAIYGDGLESFSGLSNELRCSCLWACADASREAMVLLEKLHTLHFAAPAIRAG